MAEEERDEEFEYKARIRIRKLEATIKHMKEYGIDPLKPKDLCDTAINRYNDGLYQHASTFAQKGLDVAQGFFKAYATAFFKKAFYSIENARQYGDVNEIERIYEQVSGHLNKGEFEEAAEMTKYLRQLLDDFFELGKPSFSVEFVSNPLRPGTWNRAMLRVRNTGKAHAWSVRMRLTGPVDIINVPEIPKIKAQDQVEFEVGMKPNAPGEFPLEVWFKGISMSSNKPFNELAKCQINASKDRSKGPSKLLEFFEINEIFLIYNDGRLITHCSRKETMDLDEDLIGSMLVAIRNFVSQSFKDKDATLKTFCVTDNTVVIEKGSYLNLAVIVKGTPPPQLSDDIERVISRIEATYSGVVEKWDGDIKGFKEIDDYLDPLFELSEKVLMKGAEVAVKVKSGLEFYRGFVRLKVAVINELDTTILDANLVLSYKKEALRLAKIEPGIQVHGSMAVLGAIEPKEKRTVAFYLDPLICQESTVDCTLNYKDHFGRLGHVDMKRRPVDIVCPLLYTPQTLNIAMLKRLVRELKVTDTKLFIVSKTLPIEKAFEITKEVVEGHDVKFVRELRDTTIEGTKVFEAWYYGKVKVLAEELVIKVSARSDSHTVEVLVTSHNLASLTGLLAELGHGLMDTLSGSELITDLEIKTTIESSGNLLDKISESEASTDSGDCLDLSELCKKDKRTDSKGA